MAILSLENIIYEVEHRNILENITLEVEEGDSLSLIGTSGSGKSTLLKVCADLIEPSKGKLFYRGQDYANYNPLKLRQKISYCIQVPYLFGDKVYDNLKFPFEIRKEEVDNKRILKLLDYFNLESDFLEKKVQVLSGGEKQRIALVRNLMYTPDILLLDEVTSALDGENAKLVENYVKMLNQAGTTLLWVTHNLVQSTTLFNKRISMEQGKIMNREVF